MDFIKKNINKTSRNGVIVNYNSTSYAGTGGGEIKGSYLPATYDGEGNYYVDLNRVTFRGDVVSESSVSALGMSEEGTGTTISIDVIDNLESTRPEAALSANQGRVLNEKIEEVKLSIETGGTGEASWLNLRDKPELLTDSNIQKWDDQSHTHANKDVLDFIDETKINNWDDAYTHVSDGIRHVTNDERSNWNKAVSDSHTHANKDVLDSISQSKVNNWDDVYTDFNDVFSIEGDILRVKLNLVGEKQVSAYGFSDDAGGVVTVDVVDNLTSTRTDAALSANQGRVLKGLIDSKSSVTSWDDLTDKPSTFPPSTHTHNYASTVKVGNTSYNVSANTITLPAYPTIPSSLKNPYALTISLNGTSQGAYDGSASKSINITASSVGAAASSHKHTKSQITDFPTTWSWSNVTGKPSTLSGYGITDGVNAVSVTGSGNAVTSASIAGHTLTLTKGSTYLLSSQYTASDILSKLKTVDGSGSGLDADTIDGAQNGYLTAYKLYLVGSVSDFNSLTANGLYRWANNASNRPTDFGTVFQFSNLDNPNPGTSQHWVNQLAWGTNGRIYARQRINTGSWSSWASLAYTSDNVASATKLQTQRTLWGQSFDGTANVSGNMTGVGSITASGNITTTANITADGTVVAKQASDARLKDVVKNKKTYQQRLLQLGKVIDFEYNKTAKERNTNAVDDNRHIGLIYQNVANSDLSNFAYKEADGYGSINYLSTDYINLIAGALQETIKENKKIKRELNKLKKIIEENELQ